MCFYAYKNVLEPMGHLGANLIFFILTLNQVRVVRYVLRSVNPGASPLGSLASQWGGLRYRDTAVALAAWL